MPGRSKAYESIIKGEEIEKQNVPESFNVLVRELKGLGLEVELLGDEQEHKRKKEGKKKEETKDAKQKVEEENEGEDKSK